MTWPTTSRHLRGYGTAWDKLRLRVLKRDHYLCQLCAVEGRTNVGSIVDHRKPKAAGGTDEMSNLWTLCHQHDADKQLTDKGFAPRETIGVDGWPIE